MQRATWRPCPRPEVASSSFSNLVSSVMPGLAPRAGLPALSTTWNTSTTSCLRPTWPQRMLRANL
eukprot:11183712-Lingulodinium_polyedra.AAC.1